MAGPAAAAGSWVWLVDMAALPGAVSVFTSGVDLIVASGEAAQPAGWWTAVHGALRPSGHAAILCDTADVSAHAAIVSGATSAGLAFTQHLVVADAKALDDAVATEAVAISVRRGRTRVHRRRHRDVYVFANADLLVDGASRWRAAG